MLPLLIDEGLPDQVATALAALGLDVLAVGQDDAPPKRSDDEVNVAWCKERGAVLVTNDRGRKEPIILESLRTHHVGAIFVYKDLRAAPAHHLARALLRAEQGIVDHTARRKLLHHRLMPTGRLDSR